MNITEAFNGEVVVNKSGIKAQRIYDNPEAQVIHITFEAGARLNTHTTPVDVFFYILEGTAWIEIGEERNSVGKDNLVESPKEVPHAIENYSKEDMLRVMVVKAPRP